MVLYPRISRTENQSEEKQTTWEKKNKEKERRKYQPSSDDSDAIQHAIPLCTYTNTYTYNVYVCVYVYRGAPILLLYINRRITLEFVLWSPLLCASIRNSCRLVFMGFMAGAAALRLNVCLLIFIQIYFFFGYFVRVGRFSCAIKINGLVCVWRWF